MCLFPPLARRWVRRHGYRRFRRLRFPSHSRSRYRRSAPFSKVFEELAGTSDGCLRRPRGEAICRRKHLSRSSRSSMRRPTNSGSSRAVRARAHRGAGRARLGVARCAPGDSRSPLVLGVFGVPVGLRHPLAGDRVEICRPCGATRAIGAGTSRAYGCPLVITLAAVTSTSRFDPRNARSGSRRSSQRCWTSRERPDGNSTRSPSGRDGSCPKPSEFRAGTALGCASCRPRLADILVFEQVALLDVDSIDTRRQAEVASIAAIMEREIENGRG